MTKRHPKSTRRSSSSSSSSSSAKNESSRTMKSGRRDTKRRSSSRSSSDSDSRRRHKSGRRRDRDRSSESENETGVRGRYSKSSRKSRSKSPSSSSASAKLNKNFDFKPGLEELYKNENRTTKSGQLTKMDIERDSFKPQEFRSSRGNRHNPNQEANKPVHNEHEKAMFGIVQSTSSMFQPAQPSLATPVSSVGVAEKTLMHPIFFQDLKTKEARWKEKVVEYLKTLDNLVK